MTALSLKNLFGKKLPEEVDPSVTQELSLGAPGPSTAAIEAGSTQNDPDSVGEESIADEVDEAELLTIPFLGRRTTTTHQRALFTAL